MRKKYFTKEALQAVINKKHRKIYYKRRAAKLCVSCRNERDGPQVKCSHCREKIKSRRDEKARARDRAYYRKMRALKMCTSCKNESLVFAQCKQCRLKAYKRRQNRARNSPGPKHVKSNQ